MNLNIPQNLILNTKTMNFMFFCAFIFLGACYWREIHRWVFFPHRHHDFEHRLYRYWFDEGVAYGPLAKRSKLHFIDIDGFLYEDLGSRNKFVDLFTGDNTSRLLPQEVQDAYKSHVYKKFEEVILGHGRSTN